MQEVEITACHTVTPCIITLVIIITLLVDCRVIQTLFKHDKSSNVFQFSKNLTTLSGFWGSKIMWGRKYGHSSKMKIDLPIKN